MAINMKPDYIGTAVRKAAAFFSKEETLTGEAFLVYLDPVKNHLYNFIYKALYFSEDANDVYQETVLRAFKYRSSYNTGAPFKTWIFTIAFNEIKRFFNTGKKSPGARSSSLELEENLDYGVNESEKKLVHDIYEVALQLTPQQQRVFFLFYDDGFSMKEIVDITGLKEGNIKFILNQAREKIKQKLSSQGSEK